MSAGVWICGSKGSVWIPGGNGRSPAAAIAGGGKPSKVADENSS